MGSRELPTQMQLPRNLKTMSGKGEAWYYVSRTDLDICVADGDGKTATNFFMVTKEQLERAHEIIKEEEKRC